MLFAFVILLKMSIPWEKRPIDCSYNVEVTYFTQNMLTVQYIKVTPKKVPLLPAAKVYFLNLKFSKENFIKELC